MSRITHIRDQSIASGIIAGGAGYLGFDYNAGSTGLLALVQAVSTEAGERLTYDLAHTGNQTEMNIKKALATGAIATVINYFYPIYPSLNQGFNFIFAFGSALGGESLAEMLDGSSHHSHSYASSGGQGAVANTR